jgi:hypothetical protein
MGGDLSQAQCQNDVCKSQWWWVIHHPDSTRGRARKKEGGRDANAPVLFVVDSLALAFSSGFGFTVALTFALASAGGLLLAVCWLLVVCRSLVACGSLASRSSLVSWLLLVSWVSLAVSWLLVVGLLLVLRSVLLSEARIRYSRGSVMVTTSRYEFWSSNANWNRISVGGRRGSRGLRVDKDQED